MQEDTTPLSGDDIGSSEAERGEMSLSRRGFLKGLLALSAALALPKFVKAEPDLRKPDSLSMPSRAMHKQYPDIDNFSERVLKPAMQNMADDIDRDMFMFLQKGAL